MLNDGLLLVSRFVGGDYGADIGREHQLLSVSFRLLQ
jgi:hypothetical protein